MKVKKIKKTAPSQTDEIIEFKTSGNDLLKLNEVDKNVKLIKRQFNVEIKEIDGGKLQAIVNSGEPDRYNEVLDMKGLDIKKYMTNPVIAYSHDYQQMSVGRTDKLTKTHDGKLIADFVFATDVDGYETPKILDQLYRKKYQFAFSIGFIPLEMKGNVYTQSEMIEFSPVLIGADSQALLKSFNLKDNVKRDLESKFIIKNLKNKNMKKKMVSLKKVNSLLEAQKLELTNAFEAQMKEFKVSLDPVIAKNIADASAVKNYADITKEEKLKIFVKGLASNDMSEYRAVLKSAGNTTDDFALMPPTEFVAEVLRLEESYGVANKYCNVKRTNSTSVTVTLGDGDVIIYETAELGVKKSTKLSYLPSVITLKKFTGLAPVSDELLEDSGINIWDDLTKRFARAYAKKADELVFTRATTGLVNVAGTAKVTIDGGSIEDISFDDVNKAIYSVPTPSMENGRFYFNRTILGVLQRIKDLNGNYIWKNGPDGIINGTIWGYPYTLTEVLPGLSADAEETGFIVFGDLKNVMLLEKNQMTAKIFDTGTVEDPDQDETDEINLLTQDAQAMRVVKRMNSKVLMPSAFAIIQTSVSSS